MELHFRKLLYRKLLHALTVSYGSLMLLSVITLWLFFFVQLFYSAFLFKMR